MLRRFLRPSRSPPIRRRRAGRSLPGGKLQVGCGRSPLEGWINADLQALPGVDLVLDVRRGIPLCDLDCVFAEHFLEHLTIDEALQFLSDAHGALAPRGRIRLSTPNLEWVWATHDPRGGTAESRLEKTLVANRAFYGWQHRFLWTAALLEQALGACGFREVRFHAHGESEHEALRGLERHERYADSPELPHVLVVEAERGEVEPDRLEAFRALVRASFLDHLRG